MKLLLVVLAVGLAAALQPITYDDPKGITFYELSDWVTALEDDFYGLVSEVSGLNTLIQVAIERLNYINDYFLPRIRLINKQQTELAESIRKQLKELQHIVDDLRAQVARVTFLAESTRDELAEQRAELSAIRYRNDEQDQEIDDLERDVAYIKQTFLDNLASNITALEIQLSEVRTYIFDLRTFVGRRKCEYGHGFSTLDSKVQIKFKTTFETEPSVAVAVSGFAAHIVNGYGKKKGYYDEYYIYKQVESINKDSFWLEVKDLTDGKVSGKFISCVWMACQYLDTDFDRA